jgi:hypothetical protein
MKSETQTILITIDKAHALSVINALRKGLGRNEHFEQTEETHGALKLLKLLDNNFVNSTTGIHTI